jgi:large subunit ribosomal protein L4
VVTDAADRNLQLASRNLPKVSVTSGESLNTYEVLRFDKLVFTRGAFEKVEQRLAE